MMQKSLICFFTFVLTILLTSGSVYAQGPSNPSVADKDLELLRTDLRSAKKQILAANLQLTDVEATKFWPVYDQYAAELAKVFDARYALIKEYAANLANLTDAQAESLSRRYTDSDEATIKLRQRYFPIFAKVITGKKTALFYQLDRRLALMIDLQLASEIPLVRP